MPFDGTDYPTTDFTKAETLRQIDGVIDLLALESRWCKGVLKTPDGRRCLMGALRDKDAPFLEPLLRRTIQDVTGRRCWSVASFNDARSTTHALVLRVLYAARETVATGRPGVARRSSVAAWLRAICRVDWPFQPI